VTTAGQAQAPTLAGPVYSFAFRGRWLVGHLLVLAIAALFVRLGVWQLDRLDEVRTLNRTIEAREGMAVVPLHGLLGNDLDPRGGAYRRVTAAGTYDPDSEVAVQFRALNGEPGRYLLTALRTSRGVLAVNRGWVPASGPDVPIPFEAAPAGGSVQVTGVLLPFEEDGRVVEGPPGTRTITRIDQTLLSEAAGEPSDRLFPLHLQLGQQSPSAARLPVPVPLPGLDEGPHLSYAIQWFLFTVIGLCGWPLLVRRSARDRSRRSAGPRDPEHRATEPVRNRVDLGR
jgi:cytochrome oxidase assembly protein ShyY1